MDVVNTSGDSKLNSNNSYLKGIKSSNNLILNEIYNKFFPILKSFVLKNNGTEDDAQDCFQEALIATYRRLQKEDFEITTTFSTYIFNVGKFIWFKKAKKKVKTTTIEDFRHGEIEKIEESIESEDKYALFKKGLSALSSDCQKIMSFFFEGKKFVEIAELMGYTGSEYARRKKYLCTKTLMEKIKTDPAYLDCY